MVKPLRSRLTGRHSSISLITSPFIWFLCSSRFRPPVSCRSCWQSNRIASSLAPFGNHTDQLDEALKHHHMSYMRICVRSNRNRNFPDEFSWKNVSQSDAFASPSTSTAPPWMNVWSSGSLVICTASGQNAALIATARATVYYDPLKMRIGWLTAAVSGGVYQYVDAHTLMP